MEQEAYTGPSEEEVLSWNEHNDHAYPQPEDDEEVYPEVHLALEQGQATLCKSTPAPGHTTDTPAEADCPKCLERWGVVLELMRQDDWAERIALAASVAVPVLVDPELFFVLTLEWDVSGGKERQTFHGTVHPNGLDAAALYGQILAEYLNQLGLEQRQVAVLLYGLMPLKWQH
jgi:hypothetical protein